MLDQGTAGLDLLVLQSTPFCNIDCEYCYLPSRDDTSRMTIETVRKCAEFAAGVGSSTGEYSVVWHAGEPLVLPASWYAQAHEVLSDVLGRDRVKFHFQTNGTLFSPEWVQFVASDDRVRVGISIDGPEHLHDIRRKSRSGKGTHRRVMSGIEALRQARVSFHCIAVVTDHTLDYPDEFYEFFANLQPIAVGLNVEELEGANRASSLLGKINEGRYRRFLNRLAQLALGDPRVGIREFIGVEAMIQGWHRRPIESVDHQNIPWKIITIDWQGNVHTFAPELLGVDIPGIGPFLGNVHCDDWKIIMASAGFSNLEEQVRQGVDACRSQCSYFEFCGGGSPANKWFELKTFAAAETMFCRFSRKMVLDEYLAVRKSANRRGASSGNLG